MATVAEALAVAADHHQSGRLAEAETLYRRILDVDPDNAAALHLFGVLAAQCGAFDVAADHIGRAIDHNPTVAEFHRHHAMALDRLGRVVEAADAYGRAAALDPGHADTQFNHGVLLDRLGQRAAAADAFARALDANPRHAAAANNRGLALRALGRTAEAADSFARAGRIDPGFGAAWYHQALALAALGRLDDSTTALRRAVVGDPGLSGAHVNLGNRLPQTSDAGLRHYQHALKLDPRLAGAWRGLAQQLHARGRQTEAAEAAAEAIRLGGGEPILWNALGTCRLAAGDRAGAVRAFTRWTIAHPDDAEAQFALAVTSAPNDPALADGAYRRTVRLLWSDHRAWANLALLRLADRRPTDALAPLRTVVALRPDLAEPWFNLGHTLRGLDRAGDGVGAYRRALILAPDQVGTAFNRALDLQELGRIDAAAEGYRHTLVLDPTHRDALCNLSSIVRATARYAEATAGYRRAQALEPDNVDAHRNLLSSILYDPGWTEAMRFAEHRRFERLHAAPLYASSRPCANDRDPNRRLRVGYLSADFRSHPVARNLEPILANHDHQRFEITAYAHVARPDETTERLRPLMDRWREVGGLSDAETAARVRADGIDVLVIVAGRFDSNRPLVAAHRAAPVQISLYDGATSGLSAMDYLITDRVMTPRGRFAPADAESFAERPIRLPTLFAYPPIDDAPPPEPPPLLARGGVTFGSFNNPAKQSDAVLALWGRVLRAVPGSRLVLKYKNLYAAPELAARARAMVADQGVDPARVLTPASVQDRRHHLALYHGIDIALDPFPFCGATTSFEALWMGVPVVTRPGANMMSRWSASLLSALDLPDLIATDDDSYVAIAAALAADPARLTALRATLRARIAAAPFLNGPHKARQMERVYRALWRRWARGIV
ncbi:tetratricopeptide repeat protein [Azospirillum griseum]|uniref:protein O-GlcNAc transferase n=1 Tax=Azospirillum griseum TaxID=2496639 RepID=A0A3S0I186_9PROT|nr:tetratricopeptide repeat protein [Azospirillum griseum]RTR20960.1 tetratricopeptide repeat protein [Azospirillum griseum]